MSALLPRQHGSPNPAVAQKDIKDFENAVLLAEKIGLDTVITFRCPGDSPQSQYPNCDLPLA